MLANINMELILEILFFFLNNTDIIFLDVKGFSYKCYIIIKVLCIFIQIKLIDKKKFVKAISNKNLETSIIYVVIQKVFRMKIYLFQVNQVLLKIA